MEALHKILFMTTEQSGRWKYNLEVKVEESRPDIQKCQMEYQDC